MANKVTSKNQSGGITAGQINVGNQPTEAGSRQGERPWWKKITVWAAIATIVGGIIVALQFAFDIFGFKETQEMSKEDKPTFDVRSYNQSGGITAGQINVGKQPRVLNEASKEQLRKMISEWPGAEIVVAGTLGDGESMGLAQKIIDFLRKEGREVSGPDQVVMTQPFNGVSVNHENGKIQIRVGHQ